MSNNIRSPHVLVERWIDSGPSWLLEAYRNNPTVRSVMFRAALHGCSKEDMLWTLAEALIKDNESLKKILIKQAETQLSKVVIKEVNNDR